MSKHAVPPKGDMTRQGLARSWRVAAWIVLAIAGFHSAQAEPLAARADHTTASPQRVAQILDFFESQAKLRGEERDKAQKRRETNQPQAADDKDQDKKKPPKRRAKRTPPAPDQATEHPPQRPASSDSKKPKRAKSATTERPKEAEKPKEKPKDKADNDTGRETKPARPKIAKLPGYIRAKRAPVAKVLGPETTDKIFSDEFTPMRRLAIARSARVIPGYECPSDPPVALTDVVAFPVKPATTSWIETYIIGCKPRSKRSFLVMLEDGKPLIAELLPGLSVADPLLQRDAVAGAQYAVKSALPEGCENTVVADTRLAEPIYGSRKPWVEVWTVDQCGHKTDVEMRFTPSETGGTAWAAKLLK